MPLIELTIQAFNGFLLALHGATVKGGACFQVFRELLIVGDLQTSVSQACCEFAVILAHRLRFIGERSAALRCCADDVALLCNLCVQTVNDF